jgi:excisionase family DNA binding protein
MVKLNEVRTSGPGDYVSIKEASLRSKISTHTLYHWVKDGKLPAYSRGHAIRVKMSEVLAPMIRKKPGPPKGTKSAHRLGTFVKDAADLPEIPPAAAPDDAQVPPSPIGIE